MLTQVFGLNHKTAPLELREVFYLRVPERELILSDLKAAPAVIEAIVLSTCNRTEIYANMIDDNPQLLLKILLKMKNLPLDSNLHRYCYFYRGRDAVRHLLRVTTGLDSLILGEQQILGQFKEAVALSRKQGMMSKGFNILSNLAIRAGKKAQSETQIGCGGSSVSWAAVAMAEKTLNTLRDKSVLMIGAGKMSHLAAGYLKEKGARALYIMNRTLEHSQALAQEFGGTAVSFWEIKEMLTSVDVCICSTGCPFYLIEKDLIGQVMRARKQKSLVLIDISMPRNINPEVASLAGVSLMAIDDLNGALEDNAKKRNEAVAGVEKIILRKIDEYYQKLSSHSFLETAEVMESVKIG